MTEFKLSTKNASLNLHWDYDGDYYVSLTAKVHGFEGHSDGHVDKREFEAFLNDLVALDKTLKGKAAFTSVMPGLFNLTLSNSGSRGHLQASGTLVFAFNDIHFERTQKFEFEFDLDPNQLNGIARVISDADSAGETG